MTPQRPPSDGLAVRRLVWVSFVIALVVYGIVGTFVFSSGTPRPSGLPGWLWPLVAVVFGLGSLIGPGFLSRLGPGGAEPALLPAELAAWGLAEGVGVVGLVSVALGGSTGGLVLYLAAALVLLFIRRPMS
jgi:hypothetical protein